MLKEQQIINDHILSFVWTMLFILPDNELLYFFVPLAFIVLFDTKKNLSLDIIGCTLLLILLLLISIIINISEQYFDMKDIYRIVVLIILFASFGRTKGCKILAPYIYCVIFYLLISQIAYVINIPFLKSFFETYYPNEVYRTQTSKYLSQFTISDYGVMRLGGLYSNPNHYARYLQLVFIVLFCEIKQFSKKSLMIILPLIFFSLIATGSRTSFIILSVFALYYLFIVKYLSLNSILLLGTIVFLVFGSLSLFVNISESRILQVGHGFSNNDSFGIKLSLFGQYIDTDPSMIKLLFGNLSEKVMKIDNNLITIMGMDFEIGNLFLCFGILFCIILFAFYVTIYKKYLPKYRVVFIILLWMFSSSILMAYRMAPLWLLVLGLYYRRSLVEKLN